MSADTAPIRIYVLRDDRPHCLAMCEEDALGFTLRTMKEEGQILDGDCVGILDRPDGDELPGYWLVNPWPATPFGTRR